MSVTWTERHFELFIRTSCAGVSFQRAPAVPTHTHTPWPLGLSPVCHFHCYTLHSALFRAVLFEHWDHINKALVTLKGSFGWKLSSSHILTYIMPCFLVLAAKLNYNLVLWISQDQCSLSCDPAPQWKWERNLKLDCFMDTAQTTVFWVFLRKWLIYVYSASFQIHSHNAIHALNRTLLLYNFTRTYFSHTQSLLL